MAGALTDIPGVRVGHATDAGALTGCTVVLFDQGGVTGGIDRRGQATSTRQIDALDPTHLGREIHGIYLTGGSAFGLDSAAGVMRFLEEKGTGLPIPWGVVPSVPTAVIFDLAIGDHRARPTPEIAYAACESAAGDGVPCGSVGAGTGASVGKLMGIDQAMKGGVGTASAVFDDGLAVGALAIVNAFGDVVDWKTGSILAGARTSETGSELVDSFDVLSHRGKTPGIEFGANSNTVLVVVGSNARLDKTDCCRVAKMAQTGLARAVRPCHAIFDGDVVFSFATGEYETDLQTLGAVGARLVSEAITHAVKEADGLGALPAWKDLR